MDKIYYWKQISLELTKNLYNKVININFKKFIRSEKKFRNLKHLKQQIKLDIKKAKK